MANRFNQYKQIDYTQLPVDYLQMAAVGNEQANMQQLQQTKAAYDSLQGVQASYNPDSQLKDEVVGQLHDQIKELAGKNLKGSDVLLKLRSIINNPDAVEKLAGIATNTVNYKRALAANKVYSDKYGNDINTVPFNDQVAQYNKLDKSGFKSGFQSDYEPGAFVDVVGDVQKVLKDAKADGWKQTFTKDGWIYTKAGKSLPMSKLLEQSGLMLNDPKYQTQIKKLQYYGLRKYGGDTDMNKAIDTYNQTHASALDENISTVASQLSFLKANHGNDPKYAKQIEDANNTMQALAHQRDAYKSDTTGGLYSNDLLHSLANSSSAPFAYKEESLTQAVDPYSLAAVKANLADRNASRTFQRKRTAQLQDRKYEEDANPVNPTVGTTILKDGQGKEDTQAVLSLDAKGGYDPNKLAQTISFMLLNSPARQILDENSNPVEFSYEDKKKLADNVHNGIKSGDIVPGFLLGKKEYMITTKEGKKYRIPGDLGMQKAMDPLYQFYNPDPIKGKAVTQVSLDGKGLSEVYAVRPEGATETKLFTPLTPHFYDPAKMSTKDFQTFTGIDPKDVGTVMKGKGVGLKASIFSVMTGPESMLPGEKWDPANRTNAPIRVLVKGYFPDKQDGNGSTKGVYNFSPQKLEEARKMGFVEEQHVVFNVEDGKIQPVAQINGGVANADIIKSHTAYESQRGHELYNIKSAQNMKTRKVQERTSDTSSESDYTAETDTDNTDDKE